MKKTILALGGGGFSMEPENPLLDQYVLTLANKPNPKICFLGTASGDADEYIQRFYTAFNKLGATASDLSLFNPHTADIHGFILERDILYVGGGNTRNMLAIWRDWGVDKYIKEAYENGTVLAGISAGAICWFEQGVTDSSGVGLEKMDCLGLLKGSMCPHYDSEKDRRPRYHELLKEGMLPGKAAEDGVGLLYQDGQFVKAVSSLIHKKAFAVNAQGEVEIQPEYLGTI